MPAKKQQTHAKRARELAVKEKRERKRAKKAERALAAEGLMTNEDGSVVSLETPQDESAEASVPAPAPVEAR
jgi:hypothetical protein